MIWPWLQLSYTGLSSPLLRDLATACKHLQVLGAAGTKAPSTTPPHHTTTPDTSPWVSAVRWQVSASAVAHLLQLREVTSVQSWSRRVIVHKIDPNYKTHDFLESMMLAVFELLGRLRVLVCGRRISRGEAHSGLDSRLCCS